MIKFWPRQTSSRKVTWPVLFGKKFNCGLPCPGNLGKTPHPAYGVLPHCGYRPILASTGGVRPESGAGAATISAPAALHLVVVAVVIPFPARCNPAGMFAAPRRPVPMASHPSVMTGSSVPIATEPNIAGAGRCDDYLARGRGWSSLEADVDRDIGQEWRRRRGRSGDSAESDSSEASSDPQGRSEAR
jgi:hypothetical protein